MKKLLFIGFILAIVAAIGVWYFVFYKPTHLRRNAAIEKAIVISADSLTQQFITNENTANTTYLNKAVELTGSVSNIDTADGNTIVTLQAKNGNVSVRLKETAKVQKGNDIIVKGFVTGFLESQVQVNEGLITSNNNKIANPVSIPSTPDTVAKAIAADALPIAKQYKTSTATIQFFSKAPAENIEAINKQVIASINAATGAISFTALIKGFRFENELMQEHFNGADYMNSNQFPKAIFKGNIVNNSSINYNTNGMYTANIQGTLTMHGNSNAINTKATMQVQNGKLKTTAKFTIQFADYKVASWDGNAKTAEVTIISNF